MRELERVILLRNVDGKWMDHIDAMTELRNGIGLRAYGQYDPVVEYKREGFDMFDAMIDAIREDTVRTIYLAQVRTRDETEARAGRQRDRGFGRGRRLGEKRAGAQSQENRPERSVPCGSGKSIKSAAISSRTRISKSLKGR